jgi:formate hydrogenlyase subunit 4
MMLNHYLFACVAAFAICLLLMPILTIGTIRKVKARMQNRIGPPLLQPVYELSRLMRKGETVSSTFTWIFRSSAAINLAIIIFIAAVVPWLSFKPIMPGADLFLVIYLFAAARMLTVLSAMDSGSAFGAFSASREVTVALLVEPATVLSLVAIAALSHSSDLNVMFSFSNHALSADPGIWLLVGTAVLLSSLAELSRMPVDDPTTHLELTMVHEAMILEASGRNLMLIEFGQFLRMSVLFGLASQCFLRALPQFWVTPPVVQGALSIVAILACATAVGLFESVSVKLQWKKVPEFIAYSLTMALLATLIAVGGGLLK